MNMYATHMREFRKTSCFRWFPSCKAYRWHVGVLLPFNEVGKAIQRGKEEDLMYIGLGTYLDRIKRSGIYLISI